MAEDQNAPPTGPPAGHRWHWPLTFVVIAAMALAAVIYLGRALVTAPQQAVGKGLEAIDGMRRVAEGFRTGTVTTSFVSFATEATGVQRLQVVELRQVEMFEQTDEQSALWGAVDLPSVVVRARAPVEYSYYLDLEGDWQLTRDEREIRVTAPRLEHTTPAIDVSGIEYEIAEKSVLRDEDEALARLKEMITWMVKRRARDNVPLVRELARRKTEDFVKTWLMAQFDDAAGYQVAVQFADERTSASGDLPTVTPIEPPAELR